jgi:hypothetical protein
MASTPADETAHKVRKLEDRFKDGIDLIFQLGSERGAARLVIVS